MSNNKQIIIKEQQQVNESQESPSKAASQLNRRIRRSSWACPDIKEDQPHQDDADETASWSDGNFNHRKPVRRGSGLRWSRSIVESLRSASNLFDEQDASSGNSTSGTRRSSIWTRMAKKQDIWEDNCGDNVEEEEEELSCKHFWYNVRKSIQISVRNTCKTLSKHYYITIVTLLVFVVLCAAGIIATLAFAHQYEQEKRDQAMGVAMERGQWFRDQMDAAILPLFSMAQFVKELPYFSDLPFLIGPGDQPGSAPYINNTSHRNVTGICDDPATIENFNRIAKSIKEAAGMERVLVNVQLAPQGVLCLMYPLVNTEDFDPPLVMDIRKGVGLDLLKDTRRRHVAEATIEAHNIVTAGPTTLRLCQDCDSSVKEAIIARLPIYMPGYNINVNGQDYSSWGFAVALINWGALVKRSDIFKRFKAQKMEFILSRTAEVHDETTGDYNLERKTLAESEGAYSIGAKNFVNTSIDINNNEWEMSVGYEDGLAAPWSGWATALTVVTAFFISVMLMMILMEKQNHKDLLREMLPKNALKKIQKGETCVERYNIVTAFFSDIVGYTSMSAEMRPIQVMKMLNSFYNAVDKLAGKHGVYKIETIGDAYMCVGGCPDRCLGPESAERVALFALDLIELVKEFRMDDGSQILIRAGISSGPVVAGVVGSRRPQYTIFGDTVNTAARMESTSERMKIQCSEATYRLLRDAPNYTFKMVDRGQIEAKGKGKMQTWFIEGAQKGKVPFLQTNAEAGDSTTTASTDCHPALGHASRNDMEAFSISITDMSQVEDDNSYDEEGDSCSIASMKAMDEV